MRTLDRRQFLRRGVFAATAGLALDACAPAGNDLIPILVPEESFIPGVESWEPSTCTLCEARCGVLVRKIEGRLVKVEGLPEHPVSRGGVCPRGQALPQEMYHPDRLQGPLAREGERGEGRFRPISWEEAIERAAEAATSARELGLVTPELTGHRAAIARRFLKALGRGRHLVHAPFPTSTLAAANARATGHRSLFGHDLDRSNYVLSLGAELLESHLSPVGFQRGLAEMRQGRSGRRGKLVMVGPRLSLTAANADEWVPARPGLELEVALALATIVVERELYDGAFVDERAEGFEAFRALLEAAPAAARAEKAEVPLSRLERIAVEMAEHRPALAIAGGPSLASPRGVALALTASHLNALVGAYGDDGTLAYGVAAPGFAPWEVVEGEEPESASLARALAGDGSLPDVLFIGATDPLYALPPGLGLREKLARVETIVSFASFHDETTSMADLVLPESASFERFEDAFVPGASVPMATLSGPLLVRPLYDTRSMPDALIAIARAAGRDDAFPWPSYEAALREAWSGLDLSWDQALSRGGYWEEASDQSRSFATETGRYRFDVEGLDAPVVDGDDGLELHLYASSAYGDGRAAHLPFLQELADPITGARWTSVVEIAPSTAASLGIADGDAVRVSSAEASVTARAHVSPGVHPRAIALAVGQGHAGYGRYAEGRGVNGYALLEARANAHGHFLTGTRVTVERTASG